MKKKLILIFLLIPAVLILPTAQAETINISYAPYYQIIDNSLISFDGSHPSMDTVALIEFDITGDFTSPGFCVDYNTGASLGTGFNADLVNPLEYTDLAGYYYDLIPETSGQYAVWLMSKFSIGINGSGVIDSYNNDVGGSYTMDDWTAALQLVIWDALYDYDATQKDFDNGTYGVSGTDRFQFLATSGDMFDLFTYFENQLSTSYSLTETIDLAKNFKIAKVTRTEGVGETQRIVDYQDILVYQPVPEPATMILFGFGLLGMGAVGRRKS